MELNIDQHFFSNNLTSIENQFKFIGVGDKDSIEQSENGTIQHKLDMSKSNSIDWEKLKNMISFLLHDRNGQCHYELKLYNSENNFDTEEFNKLFKNIKLCVESLNATIEIIKYQKGIFGVLWEFLIEKPTSNINSIIISPNISTIPTKCYQSNLNEIKIGLFGEESSGKSTTLSILLNGVLDDGEGSARKSVFRFQHEITSGKTLSISHQIVGFDQVDSVRIGFCPPLDVPARPFAVATETESTAVPSVTVQDEPSVQVCPLTVVDG